MNVLNITKSLHERINSATSLDEILILTKTIDRLNLGTVKTVTNYSDLLSEYPREGEVFFVENEEQLYYGFNGLWFQVFRTATTIAYGWGNNSDGRLGDNTTSDRSSPVSVVGGFTDWTMIAAGGTHSLGLRANGTLWGWGNNQYGNLGDGATSTRSSPVSVVGGFTDWISVDAAEFFSVGLRTNGILWSWGRNTSGQLGDGTTSNRSSPVSVIGGFTDWTMIAAGGTHSLGLRANGTLWGWGNNGNGRLGDNTTSNRSSPVSVVGGFTNWTSVSVGTAASMALRANGTLWSWGNNSFGQLGDNTTSSRSSPVSVVGGFTDWISMSVGSTHRIALRANGTLWSWGINQFGQLGDNTVTSRSSPVSVVGGFTDWTSVSGGENHTIGLRSNGTLWAWGNNSDGRLGDNTTSSRSSPVSVVGGFTDWVLCNTQINHNFAIRSTT